MKKRLHHFVKYAMNNFLIIILAFSFIQWVSDGLFPGSGVLEAKVIEEARTPGERGETIFDKAHPKVQAVLAVQKRYKDLFMAEPGTVGTAVGLSEDLNPVLFVLAKSFETAKAAFIPENIDGVRVVVKITGELRPLHLLSRKSAVFTVKAVDPTQRFPRPVPIGVSTGHPNITAGTIGCRVTDGTNVYALSNNHVYADENMAAIGDAILQPGTFDGGINPADQIGTLYDFEPIVFSTTASNEIDAAVALSSTVDLGNATPPDGYGTPISTPAPARLGQKVMKYGRTTSQTVGRIWAINATVDVQYESGVARFVNQIIIGPGRFSDGGDSGSLIVIKRGEDARKPVALLFAGSQFISIANPIGAVLDRFGVTVDGE